MTSVLCGVQRLLPEHTLPYYENFGGGGELKFCILESLQYPSLSILYYSLLVCQVLFH